MPARRLFFLVTFGLLVLIMISALYLSSTVNAAPEPQEFSTNTPSPNSTPPASLDLTSPPPPSNLSISNEVCLNCHGHPGTSLTLANGEVIDLYVPEELHLESIHGELGYACVQCHTDVGNYPHPEFSAPDRRAVTLNLNQVCARCHSMQFELSEDGVHTAAQNSGNRDAAVCIDCHTAHEVRRLTDPVTHQLLPETRIWIPERCALCHNAIYQKYRESVHGAALSEGNPDVPTCVDCHGVHNMENPTSNYFRLKSPEICAKCHTDPKIMDKYGITTDVLDTYVSDFHGTTVVLFEKQSPDAEVNKPVCYDCHGVHDISRVDDPDTGLEMKENLLARCQVCHPGASANFPTAWMSHYIPSPVKYPLVYYVNLFYRFFIPATIGTMGLLVLMDASRLMINRTRRKTRTRIGKDSLTNLSETQPPQAKGKTKKDRSMETIAGVEDSMAGEKQDIYGAEISEAAQDEGNRQPPNLGSSSGEAENG